MLPNLTPEEARLALRGDPATILLDVRTAREHASHRLPGSVHVALQDLRSRIADLDPERPILVHCEHGVRSLQACEILREAGFRRISNLRGGIAAWAAAGLPIER
ncbi:MAG: rhodanese-like domain-containing protein [Planctomycetota bacterium]